MAITWAKERQVTIFVIILTAIIGPIFFYWFYFLRVAPSCFDATQNQDEIGVDCGGSSCMALCKSQVGPLVVLWSRALQVEPGFYDAVAFIENPNSFGGVHDLHYKFSFYDKDDKLITTKEGVSFANASESFAIFASGVRTGNKVISRTFFEFTEEPRWSKAVKEPRDAISVTEQKLVGQDSSPRLTAHIQNNIVADYRDLNAVALLADNTGNVVAASESKVDALPRGSGNDLTYTWPVAFTKDPEPGSCTAPVDVMLVLDRSGSMSFNSNKKRPYQPMETAKAAAQVFVDNMKPGDQIGVVSFSNDAVRNEDLTRSFDKVKAAIGGIDILGEVLTQGTNLGAGLESAISELESPHHNPNAKRAVVFLTDGIADLPVNPSNKADDTVYPQNFAADKAKAAKDKGIIMYTIGLGSDVNADYLANQIATAPDHFFASSDKGIELKGIYENIAQNVCKEASFTSTIFVRHNAVPDPAAR